MRYRPDGTFTRSPTDLANYLRCERLLHLARRDAMEVADGEVEASGEAAVVPLAIRKGIEFEAQYVAGQAEQVTAAGGRFVDLNGIEGRGAQVAALDAALADGVELIAQAPLSADGLGGFADLLELVDTGFDPELWYAPIEIKSGRTLRAAYVLQLCAYMEAIEQRTGVAPRYGFVVTGDGSRHKVDALEVMSYYRATRDRFAQAMEVDLEVALDGAPDRVAHCDRCDFLPECDARRAAARHLSMVANIRSSQVSALRDVGVDSIDELAASEAEHVDGIGALTLRTLRRQAALQVEHPGAGDHAWEFRAADGDVAAGRGFAAIPPVDDGDIFFDFEGYPYAEGGLEYLWGWVTVDGGARQFHELWADDPVEERAALVEFLRYVHERRAVHPGMHVFHYAPYEVTALKRLACRHLDQKESLDELLRAGVFVDLYAVVRQAMLVSQPSYSIKYLEPIYGFSRGDADVTNAGASIEEYERYADALAQGDDTTAARIKAAVLQYNEDDCISTVDLRDWLLERRDEAAGNGVVWPPRPERLPVEEEPARVDRPDAVERRRLVERLTQIGGDDSPEVVAEAELYIADDAERTARLLRHLLGWVRRTRAHFWGELHGGAAATPESFFDDPDALGLLRPAGEYQPPKARGGTLVRVYEFDDQDTSIAPKQQAIDPIAVQQVGTVHAVDLDLCRVEIKTTAGDQAKIDAAGAPAFSGALIGNVTFPDHLLVDAVARIATGFAEAVEAGVKPFGQGRPGSAALDILGDLEPQYDRPIDDSMLVPEHEHATPAQLVDLVEHLVDSYLVVQGPPGTGKTWSTARMVVELVGRGKTVGIMSNGRAAVRNVLEAIRDHLDEDAVPAATRARVRAAYGLGGGEDAPFEAPWLTCGDSKSAAAAVEGGEATILAGTAWGFCRESTVGTLDVLVIDEAGQVSLLHAAAAAGAARSVVLVGDPQQLAQPSAVVHPEGCGASTLDHLFRGMSTIAPDRGVLLDVTRRMHPGVARWVSDAFYDGRLTAHESTQQQRVDCAGGGRFSGNGLRLELVEHHGRSTCSIEEAEAIAGIVAELTAPGSTWTNQRGEVRPLTLDDVVIVAPYNHQRRKLRDVLPDGARVGTVDKFQGQEAAVAIWSVTASSAEDAPRGLDFLLSPNRMNVAVSRARALAIVVASPTLLQTKVATVKDMKLVNRLLLLAEQAGEPAGQ